MPFDYSFTNGNIDNKLDMMKKDNFISLQTEITIVDKNGQKYTIYESVIKGNNSNKYKQKKCFHITKYDKKYLYGIIGSLFILSAGYLILNKCAPDYQIDYKKD